MFYRLGFLYLCEHGGGGYSGLKSSMKTPLGSVRSTTYISGVQAKVSNGFGGEVLKRSYWGKRMVPDGLVQRRIDQFSNRVPKLAEGVGEFLDSSSLGGRKRKFVTK